MENQDKIPKFLKKFLMFAIIQMLLCTLVIFLVLILVKAKQVLSLDLDKNLSKTPIVAVDIKPSLRPIPTPTPIILPPIPNSKVLIGGTHTFQTFNNCGPASLSMALSHLGLIKTQAELGSQLRPYQNSNGDNDDKSVTLAELALKAEELGFIAIHKPAGNMELVQYFIANDLPVVTRTWLKADDTIGHYRVIKGYDQIEKTITQDDSLQGKDLKYSFDEFNNLWQAFNYEFLVIVPKEKEEIANQIIKKFNLDRNEWQKALEISESQIQNNPNDIYAIFNKSVALYHLGRYEESTVAFESIKNNLPFRMLWYQIEPIKAYYQLNKYEKVKELTFSILENHNRGFSELHYINSKVYTKLNDDILSQQSLALANKYNSYNGIWKVNIDDIK